MINDIPLPAGEVFDENQRLIGRYIYLKPKDQELLDQFCTNWIKTYNQDNRFFITLDLETTGLKPHQGQILLVSISWDGKQSVIFSPHGFDLTVFKEMLETVPINNQNIKFDLKWLMYHYGVECKIFLDTMVGCQLGWAGSFPQLPAGTFGLGNIAKHLLGGYLLEKETRKEFIGMSLSDGFSRKQIEYAVKDSLITHKLVYPIYKRLHNQGLWDIWEEIEKPLIETLVRSEVKGVVVNVEEVERLLNEKEKELSLIYDDIKNELIALNVNVTKFPKGMFNPGSSQQIVSVLSLLGIKVINTEKSTLQSAQAESPTSLLENIIKWRTTKGIISKFLTKWLDEHIDPKTNCIYTSFNTYGAETGRLSCKEPNMQQIPGDLRSMIVSRPDHKILSMDYSQFEFRAAAAITGEEYLVDAFRERAQLLPAIKVIAQLYNFIDPDAFVKEASKGTFPLTDQEKNLIHDFAMTDIHRRNAALILGKDVADVSSKERSVGKCVSLDTYVHTKQGIMMVGDLLPKKRKVDTFYDLKDVEILTDEGFKPAPTIYYNGKSKAIKVVTKAGRSITCSPHHRFRTIDKTGKYVWVRADKLKIGSEVFAKTCAPMGGKVKMPFGIKTVAQTKEFAKLIGILIQHANIVGENIVISSNYLNDIETIKNIPDFEKLKTKISNKKEELTIYRPELTEWFIANCGEKKEARKIPNEFLNSKENIIAELFNGLAMKCNTGIHFRHQSKLLLRQIQNLTTRIGLCGWIVPNNHDIYDLPSLSFTGAYQDALVSFLKGKSFEVFPSDDLRNWKIHNSRKGHQKLIEANYYRSEDISFKDFLTSALNEQEYETAKFLFENRLYRDEIASIENVANCEMCDVTVPDNSTVVYEGLVTHNTLGYAVLYGAGPPRVQESLAKEGFYHSLEQCSSFLDDFFQKLPKINQFINETHAKVTHPGFISTIMGRKRFFKLPDKWQTRRYEQEKQAAFREATNFCFQGANADATKKAMVQMDQVFRKYPEEVRPILLLTVHDEVVIEAHKTNAEEVAGIGEKIMIDAGSEAIDWKVPIEVSRSLGDTWQK